jgi:hypothetical protein
LRLGSSIAPARNGPSVAPNGFISNLARRSHYVISLIRLSADMLSYSITSRRQLSLFTSIKVRSFTGVLRSTSAAASRKS